MGFVDWVNKTITHPRDQDGDFGVRVLIHVPIGILMAIPVLGWGLIALFIQYENNEDFWVKDIAFKDYYGALVGFVCGILIQVCALCFLLF